MSYDFTPGIAAHKGYEPDNLIANHKIPVMAIAVDLSPGTYKRGDLVTRRVGGDQIKYSKALGSEAPAPRTEGSAYEFQTFAIIAADIKVSRSGGNTRGVAYVSGVFYRSEVKTREPGENETAYAYLKERLAQHSIFLEEGELWR